MRLRGTSSDCAARLPGGRSRGALPPRASPGSSSCGTLGGGPSASSTSEFTVTWPRPWLPIMTWAALGVAAAASTSATVDSIALDRGRPRFSDIDVMIPALPPAWRLDGGALDLGYAAQQRAERQVQV